MTLNSPKKIVVKKTDFFLINYDFSWLSNIHTCIKGILLLKKKLSVISEFFVNLYSPFGGDGGGGEGGGNRKGRRKKCCQPLCQRQQEKNLFATIRIGQ